ncbi:hypothetical protein P344_04315 [Spiroplasma mirum ATCC 29335]|uniref:Uncharacterized protein n=1 Tax=Spiroplasma mirum ATCC 29335 TaxID=838561 RepID=W0GPX9_9MOLU|nr:MULTISPECIES: hypothetical protein [Spiroplasma]AHF61133.1 putative transmembrane protein [Spiroplasma mirum ATCC 29335]AHI58188.1 hypothetical protein P344_04315 [Spiroplasma mirum ATCC 29335]
MVHKKTDSAQQTEGISSSEWGKLVERNRKEIGIVYGLIVAFGYSFVPLMLYLIPNNGPYGDLGSISNSTFFVTIQEILGALTMFIFYKPTNFICYFKMLKHKETWLIVLYGLLEKPVAMVFFQLSVMLIIMASDGNDGTVPGLLLNLNVILVAIESVIFFRAKQKYT